MQGALDGLAMGESESTAVQSVSVSSIWVCSDGATEQECCIAVEALLGG